MRNTPARPLEPVVGRPYVLPRRGTESQRARPPRCEAAPPKPERHKRAGAGFLKRPGTASFFVMPGHWNSPIVLDGHVVEPEGNANDHQLTGTLEIFSVG